MDYDAELVALRKDVTKLQKNIVEIQTTQPMLEKMLERNTKAHEKLVLTLHEIDKSMVAIQSTLSEQSKDIVDIKEDLTETKNSFSNKIEAVEDKIDSVNEEGKFNIRTFLRSYFPWIVLVLGSGIFYLSKFIKI